MTIERFADILVSAMPLAGLYLLVGLGWVIIFRATGVLNFATGQFLILGAYLMYTMTHSWSLPFLPALILSSLIVGLIGMLVYRLTLKPIAGQPHFAQIIMTFGVSIVLVGLIPIIWGVQAVRLPAPVRNERFIELPFDAFFTTFGFATMVAAALITAFVIVFLRKVKMGTQMEAAAENPLLASQTGIDVNRLFSFSWVLALVPAAIGGISVGMTASVAPPLALLGLRALAPVLIGGLDSVGGVAIGAVLVALVESFAVVVIGSEAQNAAVFGLMLLFLIFKPHGIFGRAPVRRV